MSAFLYVVADFRPKSTWDVLDRKWISSRIILHFEDFNLISMIKRNHNAPTESVLSPCKTLSAFLKKNKLFLCRNQKGMFQNNMFCAHRIFNWNFLCCAQISSVPTLTWPSPTMGNIFQLSVLALLFKCTLQWVIVSAFANIIFHFDFGIR